jgi:nitrate reductase NapAB chaperone NapD
VIVQDSSRGICSTLQDRRSKGGIANRLRATRRAKGAAVTIASWLVVVEKGRGPAVRRALARPGIECRSEAYDTLVVVTESADAAHALDDLAGLLQGVPGVREASLVTRFDDDSGPAVAAPWAVALPA